MINYLFTRAERDLCTNYVDKHGLPICVRLRYKGTDPWLFVGVQTYTSHTGRHYAEIVCYSRLAFLYYYYRSNYQHIFLKSTHPELLI